MVDPKEFEADKTVGLTPFFQEPQHLSVAHLIIVGNQASSVGVINKHMTMLELYLATGTLASKVYSSWLRTLPCGEPVLRIGVEVVFC